MDHILTISGPTCSGKTTLEAYLREHYGYGAVISHTSRQPRPNEVDGVDYHFTTKQNFEFCGTNFVEYKEFGNQMYGIHTSEIIRQTLAGYKKLVAVVEPVGAYNVRKWCRINNIGVTSIYLNVLPHTCYYRLLHRFEADLHACNGTETSLENETSKLADLFAKRITLMQSEFKWLAECTHDTNWNVVQAYKDSVASIAKLVDEIQRGIT